MKGKPTVRDVTLTRTALAIPGSPQGEADPSQVASSTIAKGPFVNFLLAVSEFEYLLLPGGEARTSLSLINVASRHHSCQLSASFSASFLFTGRHLTSYMGTEDDTTG